MVCSKCGSDCAAGTRYCGVCGAKLTEPAAREKTGAAEKPKSKQRKLRLFLQWAAVAAGVIALAVVLYLILRGTPAEAIRLNENDLSVKIGSSFQMTYKLTPEDSDDSVRWSSSDARVATVDGDGILTAVGEGDCVITALTDSGCKDLCFLRVLPILQPQEKEATGYRELYASTLDGEVSYHYGTEYALSLYSDLTGHLFCPDGVWKLTWSYTGTDGQYYCFDAELSDGSKATITYDADSSHSMHGIVTILLENGDLWAFK